DRAHNCDDYAPNVQTGDAPCANKVEQKAAYQSADNSEPKSQVHTTFSSFPHCLSDEAVGFSLSGYRVFPRRLSGESPISVHAQRAQHLRFSKTPFGK